ncbi:acetyl-CoA carboxylase biotin carboxyl carrier protein [Peribacillus sp. SCS-37]|uniref:acetyl-CoA carboxylase biotin carboxyl carrier protein n=1 Tax=Paraperibacillus esterisolvens TaxID=3115296 RepID=UPI0039058FC2
MKVQEIRELIKLVDQSSLDEFEYELNGVKLKMKKNSPAAEGAVIQQILPAETVRQTPVQQAAPAAPAEAAPAAGNKPEEPAENLHKITSPMVGTFYASPSPDQDIYVKQGSKVSKSSVVCIVEAMKLFNEIEAEVDGEIVEVLVKDGQLVEYGQPLFLVKAE